MRCDYVTQPVAARDGSPFGEGHVRCGLRAVVLCIVAERLEHGTVQETFVHACDAHADALRIAARRKRANYREEHHDGCL